MKKHDAIFLCLILGIACAFVLYQRFVIRPESSGFAVVERDGRVEARYPLSEDRKVFLSSDLGSNTLTIEDGKVSVSEADCPDRICMKQGTIDKNGQSIICLPHRLVIRIESGEEASVDGVSGS
ncbi:MAG: NusG domain II-containing protein [Lachnospiraceae bacterium]|nr:NusG domain II-containing protein [Lachnospiraceae bacterium]